ncbi:MAG: RsiV family protein [Lachnospiraceae bacterium]|nr:RsiV family protein [Lachnospiraceae bacterium]
MKKATKNGLVVGLIAALSVSVLAGCGDAGDIAEIDQDAMKQYLNDNPENIEGADWRTWGWISDYITLKTSGDADWDMDIVYMGEKGSYSSVDFYEDDESQTLIQSIEVPAENIEEIEVLPCDLNADDLDDISIYAKDTDENEYTWFYVQNDVSEDPTMDVFSPYEEGDYDYSENEDGPILESVEFDLTEYDDNDEYMVFECFGNSWVVSEESAEDYPELTKVLSELAESEQAFLQRNLDSFDEEAREFAANNKDDGEYISYFSNSQEYLRNGDANVVSILKSQSFYFDQPHPTYYYETFNIDVNTGEYILLSDIITDQDALNEIIIEKLKEDYPDVEFTDLEDNLAAFDMDAEPQSQQSAPYCFTMDEYGLDFHFAQETLAHYAYGPQEIRIEYDEIFDILTDSFPYAAKG